MRLDRLVLLAWLVAAGVWAGSQAALADDTFWVLATGREILESGRIPYTEIFSFSAPGHPWYHQEWLSHVLFYAVTRTLGPDGVMAFKIGIAVAIIVLLGFVAARRSGSEFFGAAAAAFAAWACADDLDLRAKIFTVLCSIVAIGIVDAWRRGASSRTLLLLPVLMTLWANLHYGFVYGLVIIGAYAAAETVKSLTGLPEAPQPTRRALLLCAVVPLAALACLLNPQPLGSFAIALEHLRPDNPWRQVIEWKPPVLFRHGVPAPFTVALLVQIMAAAGAATLAWRRFDLADAGLAAATAGVALQSRRFAPLFVFVATPFLARNLAVIAHRLAAARPSLARVGPRLATTTALAATLGIGAADVAHLRAVSAPGLFAGLSYLDSFPVDAVTFLRANPMPDTKLYDFYPWGGYLLWALPGVPIWVDGRAAVAYPPEIATEYTAIERGDDQALALLGRYGANVVLHRAGYPLPRRLRRNADWVRVYDDGLASIHVRRTPASAAWLERFANGELSYPDALGVQLFLAELEAQRGHRNDAIRRIVDAVRRFPGAPEALTRRQQVELNAALSDPAALRTAQLYADALATLSRR